MRMVRMPRLTLAGLMTVCITVCAGFTLRDQRIDVDSDHGSIGGREGKLERTPNTLELIYNRDGIGQKNVKYNLIQGKGADFRLETLKRLKYEGENVLKKSTKHAVDIFKRLNDVEIFRRFRRENIHHRGHDLRRLRRSEGKSDEQRSRGEGSEDTDRSRQQVDGQIGRRLISSGTGRVDSTTSVAAVLDTESGSRKSAHSQLSPSQQVNNREVNPKHSHGSSAYRLLHQRRLEGSRLFPKKLDAEIITKNLEESESFHNLENRRVTRDEGYKVGRSEALAQEVSKVSDHPNTVPKMVVAATTTVAALFGMCVMAAIFQCCCRRKRAASDSETVDGVKNASSDKKSSKSPSPEKDIKRDGDAEITENDKLLEDEDLGDFSAVQRETEILKSFRKPPPPKNRARASRVPRMKGAASSEDAFSLIKEEAEGSVKSKSSSRRNSPEKKENTDIKLAEEESPETKKEEMISSTEAPKELIEPPKAEDKRLSFEAAKQMVDSMLAEVREKGETTFMAKGETTLLAKEETTPSPSEPEEKVKEKGSANVNGVSAMEGNIFMQIDPTVKIEDPSEKKTSRIPVRATPSSPSSTPKKEASLRPTSANKDQRKFLVPSVHGEQMDQLVKSLKTKLKEDKQTCLSDRNLATSKPLNPGDEDGLEPVERERSHSDPTKKLLGVKATHV